MTSCWPIVAIGGIPGTIVGIGLSFMFAVDLLIGIIGVISEGIPDKVFVGVDSDLMTDGV